MHPHLVLALRHAPILVFDRNEPFLPSGVGYTVFREPGDSRADYRRTLSGSAPLAFDLPGVTAIVEYGIWWDWDIQHLYELEAAWVHLGAAGEVLRVEASWHGGYNLMEADGAPLLRGPRPVLYSQPGKHAFAASPEVFTPRETFALPCRDGAGAMGLHITPLFQGRITREEGDNERVRAYLERRAFTPSFVFDREFAVRADHVCPWEEMEAWIPLRVAEIAAGLRDGSYS